MKLAWEKRKHISVRIRCVVSFFVFCQANLILVLFPAHCQQVPSIILIKVVRYMSVHPSIHHTLPLLAVGSMMSCGVRTMKLSFNNCRLFHNEVGVGGAAS